MVGRKKYGERRLYYSSSSQTPLAAALQQAISSGDADVLRRSSSSTDAGGDDDDDDDERVYRNQKARLEAACQKVAELRESIEWTRDLTALKNHQQSEVGRLEAALFHETILPLPARGMSLADYRAALLTFPRLPFSSRLVYCEALKDLNAAATDNNNEFDDDAWTAASDFTRIPAIVSAIYENRAQLTAARIKSAVATAQSRRGPKNSNSAAAWATATTTLSSDVSSEKQTNDSRQQRNSKKGRSLFSIDDSNYFLSMDELREEGFVQQLLPQVTRKDGRVATEADLSIALAALDKSTFVLSETEAIAGGFVLRGQNRCKSSADLIAALDAKLPHKNWSGTLSYLPDFTSRALETSGFGETPDPVLVLLHKDMSPIANPLLPAFSTAAALVTAILFAVGVYGGNDLVTSRLVDGPALKDYSSLGWFNAKVLEVLVPVLAIQAAHEAGHWTVAWRDRIQTAAAFPTFLPFWQLPWLGAQTKLQASPQNFTSLFDFAAAGPLLGLVTSAVLLLVGLQQTATASAEALQFFPALPVSVLNLSTLGGTVVNNFLAGGSGFLTLQDPATAVPLHPLAIAGFTGLMIQSFELLPLGATDGGRLSLSLFGRQGHYAVGGVVWVGLLLASIFGEKTDLLVSAWIVYNFVQNDPEIPCRDEVAKVDLGRGAAALALWFTAALIITPMS